MKRSGRSIYTPSTESPLLGDSTDEGTHLLAGAAPRAPVGAPGAQGADPSLAPSCTLTSRWPQWTFTVPASWTYTLLLSATILPAATHGLWEFAVCSKIPLLPLLRDCPWP